MFRCNSRSTLEGKWKNKWINFIIEYLILSWIVSYYIWYWVLWLRKCFLPIETNTCFHHIFSINPLNIYVDSLDRLWWTNWFWLKMVLTSDLLYVKIFTWEYWWRYRGYPLSEDFFWLYCSFFSRVEKTLIHKILWWFCSYHYYHLRLLRIRVLF